MMKKVCIFCLKTITDQQQFNIKINSRRERYFIHIILQF
jgi:hypothetical protein